MLSKRERNRTEVRSRIVDAARRLFALRGFDEATMAEVAAEAWVSRATVFNHFSSKRALVVAITEEVLTFYQTMLDAALADRETPTPELVRALFDEMAVGIEQDRRFFRGVFREIAKIMVGLEERGSGMRMREGAFERLIALLARGQARGELTRDHSPEDLASAFDSMVNGTIIHWLYDDASQSLRPPMQRAAEVFLGPVALTPSATGATRRRPLAAPRRRRLA